MSSALVCILMELEFSKQFFKNMLTLNFMKIRPVGTVLFHTDGHILTYLLTYSMQHSPS